MKALQQLSFMLAIGTCLYLLLLGIAAFSHPQHTTRFLQSFAQSARLHVLEMVARIAIGTALLTTAPGTASPVALRAFGWALILSSAVLLCLPWRWHRSLAERMTPLFVRHVRWIGAGSLVLGGLLGHALFAD